MEKLSLSFALRDSVRWGRGVKMKEFDQSYEGVMRETKTRARDLAMGRGYGGESRVPQES